MNKSKIKRRDFLKTLGLSAVGLSMGFKNVSISNAEGSNYSKHPNLVYVFADQLRYYSCGYAGDNRAITPNIDKLASQGVNFCNAVSTMPVCSAHRASLFTGQYPSTHGVVVNELNIRHNHQCIGHCLTNAGYQTAYIGKWHLRELKNAPIPTGPARLGFDGYWAAYNFNHEYYKGKYWLNDNLEEPVTIDGYEPDIQTDLAINFINKATRKDQPFALFLSYGPPHRPLTIDNTPKKFMDKFSEKNFHLPPNWSDKPDYYMDRDKNPERWINYIKPNLLMWQKYYYAMTANLDWNIGRLLSTLEKTGISDDTIFVFSSDHGEMFGAHGRVQKLIFYEEAARVPMLIRYPGKIPVGHVSDACFGTVDIMPTLLTMMKIKVPESVEGVSLAYLAMGEKGSEPEAAFMQGMGHTFQWKDGFEWRAIRDKRYTYAIYRVDGSELLFDNKNDPYQMNNLFKDLKHKGILDRFCQMLKKKMVELNDTFEKCTWYRDHWMQGRTVLRGAKG